MVAAIFFHLSLTLAVRKKNVNDDFPFAFLDDVSVKRASCSERSNPGGEAYSAHGDPLFIQDSRAVVDGQTMRSGMMDLLSLIE